MLNRIKFFREAIKNLETLGTFTPSSRFLSKKMLRKIDFDKVEVLVELGPGNGAITKFILKKLPPKAKLICFEINDNFYHQLQKLNHPQLIVLKVSAENVELELQKLNFNKACHIISSLPLAIIPEDTSSQILEESFKVLSLNGTFTQYQYTLSYYKKLKQVFNEWISLDFELLNIPPAFIYQCKKVK